MLVTAGAVTGVATVTAIATGYEIRLTPEMIQLLTYKALGAAAIGLIIAGTWIGRGGSQKNPEPSQTDAEREALSEGPAATDLTARASPEIEVRPVKRDDSDG